MTGFREVRRTAPLIVGLIFVVASAVSLTPARASVPSGTPTFSNPSTSRIAFIRSSRAA